MQDEELYYDIAFEIVSSALAKATVNPERYVNHTERTSTSSQSVRNEPYASKPNYSTSDYCDTESANIHNSFNRASYNNTKYNNIDKAEDYNSHKSHNDVVDGAYRFVNPKLKK